MFWASKADLHSEVAVTFLYMDGRHLMKEICCLKTWMSCSKIRSVNRNFTKVDVSLVSLDYTVSCAVFDFLWPIFRTCRTRAILTLLHAETEKMNEIITQESIKFPTRTLFAM